MVKDKIATDKTVKKEIDQVKADNERQEKEIQRLEKETDALSIATSNAGKPKNFDPDRGTTTPLPPSAGASVPATGTPPAAITTTPDIASPVSYPTPEPTTAKDTAVTPEPTPAKDLETPVTKPSRVQYRQVSQPTRLSNRPARSPSLTAPKTPDTIPLDFGPGWEEVPATNNKKSSADDDFDIINFDDALAADETDAVIKKASGKTTKKQRSRATAESVDEGQMSELDIARQDLELMTDRQFYVAYGMSKAAFQQKYRALLKPAEPGYTNENVDDDDWEEDEGDYKEDPQAHAQVRKQPLPDSVLRAIERNPAMRADIIAAYKRKQGIAEGPDLLNMSDLQFYKELLAVLVIPIAGLGAAAWNRVQNALKLYRAEDVITALNKKGITVDRATLGQIKPLLLKLEQAIDVDRDGDAAKELAQRIQQTVAWGKLKQTSARPATPVQGRDEPGVTEDTVNPKFIIAQVTRLLATEARRMTNAPMAQLLAPVMKEYGLSLQQIDAMVPGGLRKAAGEYGIMMKESSWGGSGPAGLKTPYAVYTKQNGQVKRVKTTNKFGQPMNTREAEAYVAAMRKKDPARWTHDTVWVGPADHDLDETANPAQQAAIAIAMKKAHKKPKSVDEELDAIDENLRDWFGKEKWVRMDTKGNIKGDCARGSETEGKPKCLPRAKAHALGKKGRASAAQKKRREDPNPERRGKAINVATKVKEQGVYIGKSLTSVKILEYIQRVLENFIRTKGFKGGPGLVNELRPLLDQLDQVNEKDLAMNIQQMIQGAARNERGTKGMSWGMFAQELSKKIPELIRKRTTQGVTEDDLDEACWKGYHKDGMKTMFGKRYPNCVKNKNESLEVYVNRGECPGCGGVMVSEDQITEKQDACYHKVKSRYKVWPSAYASGALVQCRKKGAKNWGNKSESATDSYTGVMQSQGITDTKLLEVARKIDLFAKTVK